MKQQRRDPPAPGRIAIGSFEFDAAEGCLRRDGQSIALRPKVLDLLCYLVANPGRLLRTEELNDAVWRGTAVTPNAMTNVIGELRRLLEDDSEAPRFVETVPRRGYRFIGPITSPGTPRTTVAPSIPGFVGRAPELEVLRRAYESAQRGERRAVFVVGEPGVGKTTVVEQFLSGLGDAVVARAPCAATNRISEAYGPIMQALADLAQGPRRGQIEALLRRHAPAWLVHMPWSLEAGELQAITRSLVGDGSLRMVREGVALFAALTRDRPLVLVLEDLHWSDAATVELLVAICQGVAATRLLVVGTHRPIDALLHQHPIVAAVAQLRRRADVEVLPLAAFSVAEVQACLEHELGAGGVAARLAEPVGRHCGGNPLYVKAVCEQLRQEGWIQPSLDGWEVVGELEHFVPHLPEDLNALIDLQLQALSPESLRFLAAVSVGGDDATLATMCAALDDDEERLGDIGHQLVHRGVYLRLLPSSRGGSGAGAETYAFTHALYQRAVYNRIAPSERRRLHGCIGIHLEQVYAERVMEGAPRLAAHFEAAANFERASRYRELAGVIAMQRFDHTEALRSLKLAIAHLDAAPPAADFGLRRARLYLALANALTQLHGFTHPSVADAFARAEEHATASGALRERVRALLGASSVPLSAGKPLAAVPLVERLIDVVATAPEGLQYYSYCRAARVSVGLGQFERAVEQLARGEGLPVEPGVPLHIDAVAEVDAWRSVALSHLGYLDQARAAADRSLQRATAAGLKWGYAGIVAILRHHANLERDYTYAAELDRLSAQHLAQHNIPTMEVLTRFFELYSKGHTAPTPELAEAMEDRLAAWSAFGERAGSAFHCSLLAETYLRLGDADAAERVLDSAFALIEGDGERHHVAELWRLRGDLQRLRKGSLRRRLSPPCDAEVSYRTACEIAAAQGSKLLELRATVSLAAALHERGATAEATATLEPRIGWFREGRTSVDVRAADDLLHRLRAFDAV